ncbi:MAG TPA: PAS domain-containing protein [Enterovirga sp.]|jgi:PAS domain S-box-containing protein
MDLKQLLAESLLASASDAIVVSDRDGVIRVWNPGAERIFGHAAAEALGQSLDLIIPPNLRPRHWDGYRHVMETGRSQYDAGALLSVPGLRKDGERISLEFTIVPLASASGQVEGLAAVMRDVTARFNEVRELKRRLAAAEMGGTNGV